jgi:hypothetical protein
MRKPLLSDRLFRDLDKRGFEVDYSSSSAAISVRVHVCGFSRSTRTTREKRPEKTFASRGGVLPALLGVWSLIPTRWENKFPRDVDRDIASEIQEIDFILQAIVLRLNRERWGDHSECRALFDIFESLNPRL